MELKRKFNIRKFLIISYSLFAMLYVVLGLQPADAAEYSIDATLEIPAIGLATDVVSIELGANGLDTPELVAGSYLRAENKTLLIGHSTTVFQDLPGVVVGDQIYYDGGEFRVDKIEYLAKDAVNMARALAKSKENTLVLMTCAGELYDNGDASERLIITASAV